MDEEKLIDLIRSNSQQIVGYQADVGKLGAGENFLNFLLTHGEKKFVLRISVRNNEKAITEEYEYLKLLPTSVGPQPVQLDLSKNILPLPFMVQSLVVGNPVSEWGENELTALANTMAKFHAVKRKFIGCLESNKSQLIIIDFLEQINSYFFNKRPSLAEDIDVKTLKPKVLSFLEQHQQLFNSMQAFSLIHGDMTNQNMLFDGEFMRIIDWETACFGDNAQDFATFYYDDFSYHKWKVFLNAHQIEILITEYLMHFPDDTLQERIKVWHVFDKFCSLVYCKWKQREYETNQDEKVTITSQELESEVNKLILSLSSLS